MGLQYYMDNKFQWLHIMTATFYLQDQSQHTSGAYVWGTVVVLMPHLWIFQRHLAGKQKAGVGTPLAQSCGFQTHPTNGPLEICQALGRPLNDFSAGCSNCNALCRMLYDL